LNSARKIKLWRLHDALMTRWDSLEAEADRILEMTHPWLFHPGTKPEIIETDEAIALEEKNNHAKQVLFAHLAKCTEELFPEKPVIITQQELGV